MDKNTLDFTFLTNDQVYGDKKLKIFKESAWRAPITDFYILLGGYISEFSSGTLENREGYYWLNASPDFGANVGVFCPGGKYVRIDKRSYGGRPAVPYSSISEVCSKGMRSKDGILEVEYGEYPQNAASIELQDELERAYNNKTSFIQKTGKRYTIDLNSNVNENRGFEEQFIEEYLFNNGKKYVRVKARSAPFSSGSILSTGMEYNNNENIWLEVQPIKWLVDEESNLAVSEKILFSGVQYNNDLSYRGDFNGTDIKKFMDKYFSKEIISGVVKENTLDENEESNEKLEEEVYMLDKNSNFEETAGLKKSSEDYVEAAINNLSTSSMENRVKEAVDYINNPVEESEEDLRKEYERLKEEVAFVDKTLKEARDSIAICEGLLSLALSTLFSLDEDSIEKSKEMLVTLKNYVRKLEIMRGNFLKKMELYDLRLQGKIDTLNFRIKMYELKLQDKIDNIQIELIDSNEKESKKRR